MMILSTEKKKYRDNVQKIIVSELSHDNVRNSVRSDWLLGAFLEPMIGREATHPDKALFFPSRIYLGGEDKGDCVGILC